MDELDDEPPMTPSRRETTMRRVVNVAGNDKLHKGMNWMSIAGVVATAVFGYVSDQRSSTVDEKMATGVSQKLAVLEAWKQSTSLELARSSEQVMRLREAVAALKASNDILAAGRPRAVVNIDELLGAAPAQLAAPAPEQPTDAVVQSYRKRLLGEP